MRIKALDSIRGLLLLQMTLDHFGKPISYYLYQCFGFFSAAEGFFFLSGFVGILAAFSKSAKDPKQTWMRRRSCRIWVYHLATLFIVCMLAYFALVRIQWFFAPMYSHLGQSIPLSAILAYTPLYLDVLPLYVILLLVGSFTFPLFVKAKNKTQIFLLWIPSLVLWAFALTGYIDSTLHGLFPKWVSHGDFRPFSWQFIYFTGAAVAAWWKHSNDNDKQLIRKITPWFLIPFAFCFLWSHQFIPLELPSDFMVDKQFVGPLRAANFFIFVMLIAGIVRKWPAALDFKITNVIGRHSLDVYSAHIVLLYLWFATPGSIRYSSPWNVLAPIAACIILWALAKLREPRK